jgi:biopolymer transport protein ExbD
MIIRTGLEADPEPIVDINTTPLVDVLLVLLVMLIITIPVQLHAVSLEMPGRTAPRPAVPPAIVQLEVDAAGRFVWNGEPLANREALDARLREAAQQPGQPEIHVRAHPRARYAPVAAALTSAQRHGLSRIGLVGSEHFAQ